MKKKNQLLNILTAFLAAIGLCVASLVAFIMIYTGINGSFPSSSSGSSQKSESASEETSGNKNFDISALSAGLENEVSDPSPTILPSVTIESGSYQVNGVEFWFSDSVMNDATGKWKISTMSNPTDITEYAVGYYQKLFSSDDEIHAIINYATNTTGSISMSQPGILNVSVYQHVNEEEHDAASLFSGALLAEYTINVETGEVQTNYQDESGTLAAQSTQTAQDNQTSQESTNNFNTYNNAEQQITTNTYVLNTDSKVIHRPECSDVPQIAPQNYDTSSSILSDLIGQGYTTCGHCFS